MVRGICVTRYWGLPSDSEIVYVAKHQYSDTEETSPALNAAGATSFHTEITGEFVILQFIYLQNSSRIHRVSI